MYMKHDIWNNIILKWGLAKTYLSFDLIPKAQEGPTFCFSPINAECILAYLEEDSFMTFLLPQQTLGLETQDNNNVKKAQCSKLMIYSRKMSILFYKMVK